MSTSTTGENAEMQPSAKQRLSTLVDELISEGQQVLGTKWAQTHEGGVRIASPTTFVDLQKFAKWRAGSINLMRILGKLAECWKATFEQDGNALTAATTMMGTLEAIKQAVEHDLLTNVEDLVMAEAFSNLLEQADYLYGEGFWLAAGVLGRAVLEEHLRNWCQHSGCFPTKPRPTMNDFLAELYKSAAVNKIEMKHVESMAAVGNDAAHNLSSLKVEHVERLLRDVREFLTQHPLS